MIESVICNKLDKYINGKQNNNIAKENEIILYHKLDFSTHFKEDADAVRNIVKRGVAPRAPFEKITMRIFCRSPKVSELIMKNNTLKKNKSIEKMSHVVYHFTCNVDGCKRRKSNYIGLTTQTVRDRLGQHRYKGAINAHFIEVHDRRPKIQ